MAVLECSGCGELKTEDLFPPSRGSGIQSGRRRRCLECKRAKIREWAEKNPDAWKKRDPQAHREASRRDYYKNALVRKYGISDEQRKAQSEAQGGKCAICGEKTDLHVDHCHSKNRVRGMLCGRCNRGIGMFEDEPNRLRMAVEYLEKGGVWQF